MNNEEIYIEIKNPPLCIICLEELNGNVKKICINCDVKCHEKCLKNWHKIKRKSVCPICLKSKKFYQKKRNNEIINIEQEENIEQENIEQENIEQENIEEENVEEENMEEENEYNTDDEEDNREEEIINYYLNRRAADRDFSYYLMRDVCTSKRYISYFFICAIGLYIYEVMK